jgi:hypothetical protein
MTRLLPLVMALFAAAPACASKRIPPGTPPPEYERPEVMPWPPPSESPATESEAPPLPEPAAPQGPAPEPPEPESVDAGAPPASDLPEAGPGPAAGE